MRIAVCDDERDEIVRLQKTIAEIQGNDQVDAYRSGRALLESAKSIKYDIAFCGLNPEDENELYTAKELLALSPDTAVVFITSSREHAVEAFSIHALHYLLRPVQKEDIAEVFRRFGMKREPRRTLTLRIGRNVTILFQDEIIRVEAQRHRTLIITARDHILSVWKPYGEISAMLDDSFLHIRKGVSVNMRCISRMTAQKCIMKDGCTFLLSRITARENYERYYRFLENHPENL